MKKKTVKSVFLLVALSLFTAQLSYGNIFLANNHKEFEDKDGDGYGVAKDGSGLDVLNLRRTSDPDDYNPEIHPAADDLSLDGVDQNGDGIDGPAFDSYGGWTGMQRQATGFFRVEKIHDRWWFITPEGHPFFMNSPSGAGATADYESQLPVFEPHNYAQLSRGLGFNTIGAYDFFEVVGGNVPRSEGRWTQGFSETTPYFIALFIEQAEDGTASVIDYFNPEWEQRVRENNIPILNRFKDDPTLLGYIYSIELHWFPDHKRQTHVFDDYMQLASDAPGKAVLIEFMRDYYSDDITQLNEQWQTNLLNFEALAELDWLGPESFFPTPQWEGQNNYDLGGLIFGILEGLFFASWDRDRLLTEHQAAVKAKFAGIPAEKYYKTIYDLVREVDPNHLILGDQQVVISGSKEAVKAAAKYTDVYSVNPYPTNFWASLFAQTLLMLTSGGYTEGLLSTGFSTDLVSDIQQVIGDKPMWVEFGVIGDDTDHPNDEPGNFSILKNQVERAEFMELAYDLYLQSDQIVGIQYFTWVDQLAEYPGEFINENNQFGIYSHEGERYGLFAEKYKELNTWWLTRLKITDQAGPDVLEPVSTNSRHSTGSLLRVDNVRSTGDLMRWGLTAWFQQDFYSMAKSIEIQMNRVQYLLFPGSQKNKWAQKLFGDG